MILGLPGSGRIHCQSTSIEEDDPVGDLFSRTAETYFRTQDAIVGSFWVCEKLHNGMAYERKLYVSESE